MRGSESELMKKPQHSFTLMPMERIRTIIKRIITATAAVTAVSTSRASNKELNPQIFTPQPSLDIIVNAQLSSDAFVEDLSNFYKHSNMAKKEKAEKRRTSETGCSCVIDLTVNEQDFKLQYSGIS